MTTIEDKGEQQSAGLVATFGPFTLTTMGAVATRDATFEEWAAACKWCFAAQAASPFWIGDLLAIGEHAFGEMHSQVLDGDPRGYQIFANAVYVSKAIPASRRRAGLGFAAHQEVAPLPPEQQDAWLDKCEQEGLTQKQLRAQIETTKTHTSGSTFKFWVSMQCTSVEDQAEVAERCRQEGRSVTLTARPPR